MRLLTGGQSPAPLLSGGRRVAGIGPGFFLIGAGAVLLLAVRAHPVPGLNLHIVGVIMMITGVLRLLLLPALPALAARRRGRPDPLGRLVNPSGLNDPAVHDAQAAAAIDVAEIRADHDRTSPSAPGRQLDEL